MNVREREREAAGATPLCLPQELVLCRRTNSTLPFDSDASDGTRSGTDCKIPHSDVAAAKCVKAAQPHTEFRTQTAAPADA